MYLNFFGLNKKPFHITPDPEFFYLSPSHKEALGTVIYGIEQRLGFIAITGEVGTGKTTVIRSYLEETDHQQVIPVYIFNARVSFQELLNNIFRELGCKSANDTISDMVHQLHIFLIEQFKQNKNIVLIIDEAQNMPVDTLEQLRMLSNLETTKEKLLQIVLVGQPELDEKLNRIELRQLKQRLALRATISPLSPDESLRYINHRLSKATSSPQSIFSKQALRMIIKHSRGTPRLLNTLCGNALVTAYGYQKKQVNIKIVKESIKDFFHPGNTPLLFRWRSIAAFGLILIAAGGLFSYVRTEENIALVQPRSQVEKTTPVIENVRKKTQPRLSTLAVLDSVLYPLESYKTLYSSNEKREGTIYSSQLRFSPFEVGINFDVSGRDSKQEEKNIDVSDTWLNKQDAELYKTPANKFPITYIVQKGDNIGALCRKIYGFAKNSTVETIKKYNPNIKNADRIIVGETITFPRPDRLTTVPYGKAAFLSENSSVVIDF